MRTLWTLFGVTVLVGSVAHGQTNQTRPSFVAADIQERPPSVNPPPAGPSLRNGRYQFRNATMLDLITSAYGVLPVDVRGGPGWLEWFRFDVIAVVPKSTAEDTTPLMLRTLLAERFTLAVHRDGSSVVVDRVNDKPTAAPPDTAQKIPSLSDEFEAADIKPSAPDVVRPRGGFQPGGRVDMRGFTLRNLITTAWDLQDDLVLGSDVIDKTRFDIVAAAPAEVSTLSKSVDVDTIRLMLRNLLVRRFNLMTHYEERPVPAFALLSPRRETRLKSADRDSRTGCKRTAPGSAEGPGLQGVACQNMTMTEFAQALPLIAPAYVNHPSVDMTSIEGRWSFTLSWASRPPLPAPQPQNDAPIASDPNGSLTLFEAIEKQLGLKIELQRHPMQVMVVDHVEPAPVEN